MKRWEEECVLEAIRQWAFGVCAAAVACALAQLMLPNAGMQRVFNITCSVFFLCCLLSPVAFAPISLDLAAQEEIQGQVEERARRLEDSLEADTLRMAETNLRQTARQKLDQLGVEGGKISVDVHEDADNGISIRGCELLLPESYTARQQEIQTTLEGYLGVPVRIGWEKEDVYG